MTSNSDRKARIRARMAQTGESYNVARRALDSHGESENPDVGGEWEAGTTPWIRLQRGEPVLCYFCGETTAVLSYGDTRDPGRIDIYCDNSWCDARTMTVLVLRDNTVETQERADVRALRAIDEPPGLTDRLRRSGGVMNYGEFMAAHEGDDPVARRRSPDPLNIVDH